MMFPSTRVRFSCKNGGNTCNQYMEVVGGRPPQYSLCGLTSFNLLLSCHASCLRPITLEVQLTRDKVASGPRVLNSTQYTSQTAPLVLLPESWYNGSIPNNAWAELVRLNPVENGYGCDGFTTAPPWIGETDRFAYGCWFYSAPGSGTFVNIGQKSLHMPGREARQLLAVFGPTKWRGHGPFMDFTWCERALQMGYDSIHFPSMYVGNAANPMRSVAEVIICRGSCIAQEICTECPPLSLRKGATATMDCICHQNDPHANTNSVLNCRGG